MNTRSFLKNIYVRNLLGLILVFFILVSVILFWLNLYTQHGKSVEVPAVKGLPVENAAVLFTEKNLNYTVVDSFFVKGAVPGSIAETTPPIGSKVKQGRTIYLKIHAYQPQLITVPDVKNTSQRQSLAMLRALGFENVTVKLVSGIYADLTMGLASNGRFLEPGQHVPANTPISLLVSSGSEEILPMENPVDSAIDVVSSDDPAF